MLLLACIGLMQMLQSSALVLQVTSTADPFWQKLLRDLAEGSPEAGKLVEKTLSAESLSHMGARSVPSTVISALTKMLHAGPDKLMRKRIWIALRNVLKQLQAEGPASLISPSKVLGDCHSFLVACSLTLQTALSSGCIGYRYCKSGPCRRFQCVQAGLDSYAACRLLSSHDHYLSFIPRLAF